MRRLKAIIPALAALVVLAGCARAPSIERVEWTVMGTVAALQFEGEVDKRAVAAAKDVFSRVEKLLNAHDPDSELTRLAALEDGEVVSRADPFVRECYKEAFAMREASAGAFDPRWRGRGTLDLGAIAKGYAVDLAASAVSTCTTRRALVDLGGNLKAVNGPWRVAVVGSNEAFELPAGAAVATSARYFRGDHIKDARTGQAVCAPYKSVSVIHPTSAMKSDELSTVLFILGREKGERFLEKYDSTAKSIIW